MRELKKVAIVGAGFCGTMVAAQLLGKAEGNLEVHLIDRTGQFGKGVAYGTTDPSHLLNVPANRMSAFPAEPDHFRNWLARVPKLIPESEKGAMVFAPRRLYGQYLGDSLGEAKQRAQPGVTFTLHSEEVVGIEPSDSGYQLLFQSEKSLAVDHLVLAVGNFPTGKGSNEFVLDGRVIPTASPWETNPLHQISPDDDLLILGSGLTMVDTVITLKERGHRGTIRVISRHGLFPKTFELPQPFESNLSSEITSSLPAFAKQVRAEAKRAEALGLPWHSVMAALRPKTTQLWKSLMPATRARFLRHMRQYWDVHRHQIAPEVSAKITHWRERGEILFSSGRLKNVTIVDNATEVTIRERGSDVEKTFRVKHLVNCTGLDGHFGRLKHPFIEGLRRQGLIQPDPNGLGLETTAEGFVVNAKGTPAKNLFAIGAMRRGNLWESSAVPELRAHAEDLARTILAELRSPH